MFAPPLGPTLMYAPVCAAASRAPAHEDEHEHEEDEDAGRHWEATQRVGSMTGGTGVTRAYSDSVRTCSKVRGMS